MTRNDHRRQLLSTVADVLTHQRVNWWLSDGTLLGHIREGDFIEGDTDMDLGVLAETWTPATYQALHDAGLTAGRTYGTTGAYFFNFGDGDDAWLDVFFFYPHEGNGGTYHVCYCYFGDDDAERIDYAYPRFHGNTQPAEWFGIDVRLPTDPHDYLATKYGDDWRTPKLGAEWEHINGPPNSRRTGERHPWRTGRTLADLACAPPEY